MKFRQIIAIAITLAALGTYRPVEAEGQEPQEPGILEQLDVEMRRNFASTAHSVVRVDTLDVVTGDESADQAAIVRQRIPKHFTGLVLDERGHIVTVPDAVVEAERIYIKTIDGRQYPAVSVGADEAAGVAVIRVLSDRISPIDYAERTRVDLGALTMVVGNPFGLTVSPSLGMVSGIRRLRLGGGRSIRMLQISATVNPGDYGGAVIDAGGQVIGMVVSSFRVRPEPEDRSDPTLAAFFRFANDRRSEDASDSTDALFAQWLEEQAAAPAPTAATPRFELNAGSDARVPAEDIHFALPIQSVVKVARQLIASAQSNQFSKAAPIRVPVRRPWMGVRLEPIAPGGAPDAAVPTGLRVSEIIQNGPAAAAGLKPKDVITRFNGDVIRSVERLHQIMQAADAGQNVRIDAIREGRIVTFTLLLKPHPSVLPESPAPEVEGEAEEKDRAREEAQKKKEDKEGDSDRRE